ncbi:MAG: hypothetical protein ACOYXT_10140 [Bacteroidota bacterium]
MENKAVLQGISNSYLQHFYIAQFNFYLVVKEERMLKRKFKRKNTLKSS